MNTMVCKSERKSEGCVWVFYERREKQFFYFEFAFMFSHFSHLHVAKSFFLFWFGSGGRRETARNKNRDKAICSAHEYIPTFTFQVFFFCIHSNHKIYVYKPMVGIYLYSRITQCGKRKFKRLSAAVHFILDL